MLKVSETYIVGIDISENDEAVVQVARTNGTAGATLIGTITGEDALDIYKKLTQKEND